MSKATKTFEIALPARPSLIRRLARMHESEGEVEAYLHLQDVMVATHPQDWKARLLQYDSYRASGQPEAAKQRIEQAWDDALQDTHQVAVLHRLLHSSGRLDLLVDFERAALMRNPADPRAPQTHSRRVATFPVRRRYWVSSRGGRYRGERLQAIGRRSSRVRS